MQAEWAYFRNKIWRGGRAWHPDIAGDLSQLRRCQIKVRRRFVCRLLKPSTKVLQTPPIAAIGTDVTSMTLHL